jgi:hypothetical protein
LHDQPDRKHQRLELGQDPPHAGLGIAEFIIEDADTQPFLAQPHIFKMFSESIGKLRSVRVRPSALRPF